MRKLLPSRGLLVLLGTLFVSGCALPVPIQVASWAIDGISYLATQKSVTDHGISFVTQKDCALWRTVQGKDICDDYDDAGTVAVAALGQDDIQPEPAVTVEGIEVIGENSVSSEIVAIDTASGDDETPVTGALTPEILPTVAAVPVEAELSGGVASPEPAVVAIEGLGQVVVATEPVQVAALAPEQTANSLVEGGVPSGEHILIPGQRTWSDKSDANIYYVIGSFQNRENAKRLVKRHLSLGPSVMATRINGVETYRVAVGPFTRVERRAVERTIRKTGIKDSWAISIDPSQWLIAGPSAPLKVSVSSGKPAIVHTASHPENSNKNIIDIGQVFDNKEKIQHISTDGDARSIIGSKLGGDSLHGVIGEGDPVGQNS